MYIATQRSYFLSAVILAVCTVALGLENPKIVKRGTVECDLVEATPVVFHGKLYRFEYVRERYKPNTTGKSYFRFIDVESGEHTPGFAAGHHLGCAFVDGDTVYVYGVKGWDTATIYVFWSKDLKNWQSRPALQTDDWGLFNSSVCKDDKGYLMAFEVGRPKAVAGNPFTTRFARSKNLLDWKLLDEPAVYSKAFYTACPAIRYLDGYYYMFYLAARPGPKWETDLVRSRNLVEWEKSPCNPILACSTEDKKNRKQEADAETTRVYCQVFEPQQFGFRSVRVSWQGDNQLFLGKSGGAGISGGSVF